MVEPEPEPEPEVVPEPEAEPEPEPEVVDEKSEGVAEVSEGEGEVIADIPLDEEVVQEDAQATNQVEVENDAG